jgi:AraC-like DNA-binding protein
MFAIELQASALQDEIAARRLAGGTNWANRLTVLDLAENDRACLMAAAAALMRATQPGVDRRQLAIAEGRVVGLMAGLSLLGLADERPGVLAQERVKDLERWIEAHLHEPLTLGRLCQVAGVGARCLQKAFEVRRGMSPMRFVAERRLAAAHERLRRAAPDASVTRIAMELGFDHLGRFAQMYRQSSLVSRRRRPCPAGGRCVPDATVATGQRQKCGTELTAAVPAIPTGMASIRRHCSLFG